MKKLIAGAFAVTLLLGACGGDKKDDDKADATTTTAAGASASSDLDAKLLTVDDLGLAGYTKGVVAKPDEGDDFCPAATAVGEKLGAKHTGAVLRESESDDGYGGVQEELYEFASATDAAQGFTTAKTTLLACKDVDRDNAEDKTHETAKLSQISFGSHGDKTFAAQVEPAISGDDDSDPATPDKTIEFTHVYVAVQKGTYVALLGMTGAGDKELSSEQHEAIAEKATSKL